MTLKDTYFTISEAAKELGVTRQTLYRWIKVTALTTEKIGRETLIKKTDLGNLKKRRLTKLFGLDSAIILALIDAIRKKGKYSKDDRITHIGNLVFEVKKKDGTRDIADILEVTVGAKDVKIMPYDKFRGKGQEAK